MDRLDIRPVGDGAIIARLGDKIELATIRRAWALAARVREALRNSALDVVPAYASVFVRFDPLSTEAAEVMASVRGAAETLGETRSRVHRADHHARHFEIGVCFGGEHGADLEQSAAALGLSATKLVDRLCAVKFSVAFLGFLAGFPYLVGLPAELALPRLPSPRKAVPSGSVAMAERQCGIYPRRSPGGWRLLGATSAAMFDPAREPAALLAPGDSVRFVAERRLERAVAHGPSRRS